MLTKFIQMIFSVIWCKKNTLECSSPNLKEEIRSSKSIVKVPSPKLVDTKPSQPLYVRTVQNFLLVWLDENIDEMNDDDDRNTISELREVINTVKTFTNIDECVKFITDVKDEKIFIICSDTLSKIIAIIVYDMPQIASIYIISKNGMMDEQWIESWLKIKGVFTDMPLIYEELKRAALDCDQNSITMNFVGTDSEISTQNLNKLEQSFMYTQILKEILLTIDFEKKHLTEFLTYCRQQLIGNTTQLKIIDKMEREYVADASIWWYTYDYFLYSMVNRALRTMEIDLLIKMGFFIQDLHKQITRLHLEQYAGIDETGLLYVFRGQGLSQTDFDQLQKTQNGLISFNNFLSTSYDRSASLAYAESNRDDTNLIGVLFEITADLSTSSTPFANIRNASAFQDEEEILFSMHSIFRIGEIKQLDGNERLWQVNLTLTNDNDPQLNALTEYMRKETFPEQKGWHRLGNLLIKLDQFDKAHQVFNIMLDRTTNAREKGNIYRMLGIIHRNQGKYTESVAFYQESLEIYQETLPEEHLDLSAAYNNVGLVYDQMGEYWKALWYYEKALEIYEHNLPENRSELATFYTNIGGVYDQMGQNLKALSFYEKTLEIHRNILPSNHLHLANSYDHIGAVYNRMGEYSKALSYHEKALEIYEDVLPTNHSKLTDSYNQMGAMYMKMGEHLKALVYYEKAIQISEKTLSANHPDLAIAYSNIGLLYNEMGEYSEALVYYEKALEINQKLLPENHPNLAGCYNNIGQASADMNEHSKALSYYEKALEIYRKTLPEKHINIFYCYNNIGGVLDDMGEYSKALSYFEKNLEISKTTLPENHPDLACTYNNIASIYLKMDDQSKITLYCEKSLEICQKTLPQNHPHLAISHNNVGKMHEKMGEYSKAFLFYKRALDIGQHSLPLNHPDIQQYTESLERVKTKL